MNIIETNLLWNGALVFNNVPKLIIDHHAEASNCSLQDIDSWHKQRGWVGCGYHFLVRKDGSVYRGRPENAEGAHCYGYNSCSIGVCFEGNYMEDSMPQEQKQAGIELHKYLMEKYQLDRIEPHRALYNTSCPGDKFPFDEIKNASLNCQGSTVNYQPIQNRSWLQVGDSGDKVKELQAQLMELGYDLGSYGADGSYGQATKNAVYKFQQDNGLSADGLAGDQTFKCIKDKLSAISAPQGNDIVKSFQQASNASGYGTLEVDGIEGPATDKAMSSILLQRGSKGEIVKWLQNRLIALGFSCGPSGADGDFGGCTFVAVQNFQASRGLARDGIAGVNTLKAMLK